MALRTGEGGGDGDDDRPEQLKATIARLNRFYEKAVAADVSDGLAADNTSPAASKPGPRLVTASISIDGDGDDDDDKNDNDDHDNNDEEEEEEEDKEEQDEEEQDEEEQDKEEQDEEPVFQCRFEDLGNQMASTFGRIYNSDPAIQARYYFKVEIYNQAVKEQFAIGPDWGERIVHLAGLTRLFRSRSVLDRFLVRLT
ncbi:hypothetical protein F4778DRAFT_779574 [Xylariomycetidae sp. FL2044]|nr:hypothetical protein F4778DRAFT_779574 [Xylariomycetidae sp. FL2044]